MGMADLIDLLAWIVGGIIVVTFSWNFFNQESYYLDRRDDGINSLNLTMNFLEPVLPRYASSRTMYIGWFFAFLIFTLSLYILAAFFLSQPGTDITNTIEAAGDSGTIPLLFMTYNQLLAAFLVTGMHNVVPRRFDILSQLRKIAHRQAKIPEEARGIYKRISSADLRLSEAQIINAIEYLGQDYLSQADFDARPGTIERNWATACHLMSETRNLTQNFATLYARNLHNPKLQYDLIVVNFETLKTEIKNRRHNKSFDDQLLSDRVSQFLKQVTHMVVCLVFLSESSRNQIYTRWHEMGVLLRIRPKFKINAPSMFTAMGVFSVIVTMTSFILGIFTSAPAEGDEINITYATNTAIATLLIVCMPMMFPMIVKWLFTEYWPVRGQFSRSRQPAFYVVFFMVGGLLGLFGLYLASFMGFMDEPWANYQPYVLLSGAAAALMAWAIDRKPEVVIYKDIIVRALPLCILGAFTFFALGVVAKLWSEQVAARELRLTELLLADPYLFLLISVIGAMVGATSSILADMCLRLRSEQEEVGLNISEYLLPVVGHFAFDEMDKPAIDKLIKLNINKLPNEFVNYLENKNIFLNSELTQAGYDMVSARHLVRE